MTKRPAPRERTGSRASANGGQRTLYTLGEDETFELGRRMATAFRGGELIALLGDLGLGKTVFARGIAVGLGISGEQVSSPTFAIVQEYRGGRLPMVHVDLYRIEDPREVDDLGLEDLLDAGAVVIVEWGERLPARLLEHAWTVRFGDVGDDTRRLDLDHRVPRFASDA